MTATNVTYRYSGELSAEQVRRLSDALAVYGVRAMAVDEAQKTITVEYDATRLKNEIVAAILRSCQVQLGPAVELATL